METRLQNEKLLYRYKKKTPPPPIRFKNCYPHFFQFQIKSNSKQYLHPLHITAVVTLLCATHQTSCENKNKEKKNPPGSHAM